MIYIMDKKLISLSQKIKGWNNRIAHKNIKKYFKFKLFDNIVLSSFKYDYYITLTECGGAIGKLEIDKYYTKSGNPEIVYTN